MSTFVMTPVDQFENEARRGKEAALAYIKQLADNLIKSAEEYNAVVKQYRTLCLDIGDKEQLPPAIPEWKP